MKKLIFLIIFLIMSASYNISHAAITDPSILDQYRGDTLIYGASTATLQPNVLIIFDNSGSMSDTAIMGTPYTPSTTYPVTNNCEGDTQPCNSAWVYKYVASGVEGKWTKHILLSSVYNSGGNNCRTKLNNTGQYSGRLSGATGQCGANPNGKYATGNWINWLNSPDNANYPKIAIAKKVVRELITSTSGVKFGLMNFNNTQGGFIAFNVQNMDSDNTTLTSEEGYPISATEKTLLDIIGYPGVLTPSAVDSTLNNFDNYADDSPAGIMPSTWTPLAETLFEAMRYYSGKQTAFNGSFTYTSPIEYSCQKNYVILITDGMSTQDRDNVLTTICNNGDCDGDGPEVTTQSSNGSDYLDDVAWYMYNTDLLPDNPADAKTIGKQNVITYTIGFGLSGGDTEAVTLLSQAAQNGGGQAYLANDITGLSDALAKIFANIMADNTSFVAPVVPVSPENRVYSGERVYIGFFKPSTTGFWSGNLKKYGLRVKSSNALEITDKDGNVATNPDGSFKDNSISFWSTTVDGGNVEAGGVGIQLLMRSSPRNLYTYLGTNANLTDTSNAFTIGNANITDAILGAADATERDKIIRYVHGEDSYLNSTNKRSWILGDILHSRPLIVQYNTYSMSDESSCSANKTVIYVGANDGMLHAFRDCDGAELWGFIPPDKLGHLKLMSGSTHTYYVDGTPKAYIYDQNKNGIIDAATDKVILIFGERRGGQYYYALDVTDSANPKFMWRLGGPQAGNAGLLKAGSSTIVGGSDTWFTEMNETWGDPVIGKIKLSSSDKRVAMFVGAGYDNANEDLEPANTAANGRGVYVIEIADISSGSPSLTNSGSKLWGYTNSNNSANMIHSIPSTVRAVDVNDDSYTDRLYVGDTGGKMWRFDVKGPVSGWSGKLLFTSNSGADRRKIFYEPAVTFESDRNNNPYTMLFFGTGDREHPIRTKTDATNPVQIDRMYAVKDKSQLYTIGESNLTDVTTDELQELPGTATSQIDCTLSKLGWQRVVSGCDEQDGWYIRLNQNSEEKVLAAATVFAGGAYYTTYTPDTSTSTDVCTSGNRGVARIYGVHWRTGEAISNWDTSNDSLSTTNARARDSQGNILLRSDRVMNIGTGIPSQLNIIIMPGGSFGLIGVGGSIDTIKPKDRGAANIIYWRELF